MRVQCLGQFSYTSIGRNEVCVLTIFIWHGDVNYRNFKNLYRTFKVGRRAKTSSVVSGQTLAITHIWININTGSVHYSKELIMRKAKKKIDITTSLSVTPCFLRVLELSVKQSNERTRMKKSTIQHTRAGLVQSILPK